MIQCQSIKLSLIVACIFFTVLKKLRVETVVSIEPLADNSAEPSADRASACADPHSSGDRHAASAHHRPAVQDSNAEKLDSGLGDERPQPYFDSVSSPTERHRELRRQWVELEEDLEVYTERLECLQRRGAGASDLKLCRAQLASIRAGKRRILKQTLDGKPPPPEPPAPPPLAEFYVPPTPQAPRRRRRVASRPRPPSPAPQPPPPPPPPSPPRVVVRPPDTPPGPDDRTHERPRRRAYQFGMGMSWLP